MHKRKKVTDMKTTFFFLLALTFPNLIPAQTPQSFFPSQVGNLWQYDRIGGPAVFDWNILRDSISSDSNRYLYIKLLPNGGEYWWYRLDTTNVYTGKPSFGWDTRLYRLDADSGTVWHRGGPNYSWIAQVFQAWVFGVLTTVKVIRTGDHPDSGTGLWYWEEHLASGFGVVYYWEEPGYVAFLRGCVIAGDTFGTLVSVNTAGPELPKEYTLYQNYPNPFNPNTKIRYEVPVSAFVSLKIYNVLGEEVATLANEKREPGLYVVEWNGSKYPSGIYFYRLVAIAITSGQTEKFITTKKMVLLK